MRKIYSIIVAAIIGLAVISCAATQTKTEKTLYERLGGKEALTAVVQHLWGVASKDTRINHYFAHTNPEVFAGQLIDFLCQGTGGPCQYKGKDMYKAHAGMNLSSTDFDALAEDIVITLDHFKVPKREKGEVMSMLGGMKNDVIGH